MKRHTRNSTRLSVEQLESREVPTVTVENFDAVSVGALPTGWSQWSSSTPAYAASNSRAYSAPNSLASTAASNVTSRAWSPVAAPADSAITATVYADSLSATEVFSRGQNLGGASPTFYAVAITRGVKLELIKSLGGVRTSLGSLTSVPYISSQWMKVTLRINGSQISAQMVNPATGQYLNSSGQWQTAATAAITVTDTSITAAGSAGVNRPAAYAGTVSLDDFTIDTNSAAPTTPPPNILVPPTVINTPVIPQHYSHIRIAELAYSGTPFTSFEQNLLASSVDLVVSNPSYLANVQSVAPNTPQLIYTNVSNIYDGLYLDWLNYADAKNVSRETAFYHVTAPTPFSGGSPSSIPVNWLWRVARNSTDLTSASRTGTTGDVSFGNNIGDVTYFGYPEKFGELNFNITAPKGASWSAAFEYVSAVNAAGQPTAWTTLPLTSNTTANWSRSGFVRFDPPADWKPSLASGTSRLFFVRLRVTAAGSSPVCATVLGRDYTQANGGQSGTIPAFDYSADLNHDGYLSPAEYANHAPNKTAKFVYESRLFYPAYGQMRFAVNPAPQVVKDWAANEHQRILASQPLADGFFVDNSNGRDPTGGAALVESTANYSVEYGKLLQTLNYAIGPKWVLPNTTGGNASTDEVITRTPASLEEFSLRPLSATWSRFDDIATMVASRLAAANSPYQILDTHPQNGSPTDPRTQLAALAYYYLLADPTKTMVMFFGGYAPNTSWTQHWVPAAAYNVGLPQGTWAQFATGNDPSNSALTYKVFERNYGNAKVFYKPLSYTAGVGTGTIADNTATTHQLGGNYRPLNADGTLGAIVTSITLRNGEGAILIPA
jgi:hypothetical protein